LGVEEEVNEEWEPANKESARRQKRKRPTVTLQTLIKKVQGTPRRMGKKLKLTRLPKALREGKPEVDESNESSLLLLFVRRFSERIRPSH
jgi:hypothetical protein